MFHFSLTLYFKKKIQPIFFSESKRALSAPPTEIGKVVLQRMELKSPLTVRQSSIVPFEHEQQTYVSQTQQQPVQAQAHVIPIKTATNQLIENPYNNRGILKSNTYSVNQNLPFEPTATVTSSNTNSMTMQPSTTRNVFLNRSYSEAPRVNGFTNGYETDSGLVTNSGYQPSSYRATPQSYGNGNGSVSYRLADNSSNNGSLRNTAAYRTIGPSTMSRYQMMNDQSGYDTDTGLIKLRQVLDNRRASSRNGAPIQQTTTQYIQQTPNGYYYQSRSITPSLSQYSNGYNTQGRNQSQFNSQSNVQIPINDSRFV